MTRITIRLPEDLSRWVRTRAAAEGQSVSRWLAGVIERKRWHDDEYDIAMKSLLSRKPQKLEWIAGRRPTRQEIYDRPVLRGERRTPGDGPPGSGASQQEPTGDQKRG